MAAQHSIVFRFVLVFSFCVSVHHGYLNSKNDNDNVKADVDKNDNADMLISQVVVEEKKPFHERVPLDSVSVSLYAEAYFRSFIKKYGKLYSGHNEYKFRLNIFKENLARALHHQSLDPGAEHGITPFSDLSEEEFEKHFLGLHGYQSSGDNHDHNGVGNGSPAPILPIDDLPENFDWRDLGAVTEVKTQGLCGACWAFTTAGVLEGAHFLSTGNLLNLSEQQLLDCDKKCDPTENDACDSGCKGGLMTNAYEYVIEAGGIMTAEDYPYQGVVDGCSFNPDKIAVKLESFHTISSDEDQIAANLVNHGPLAVGLNAAFMQTYIGGVSCPLLCNRNAVNHGVLLVGYQKSGFAPLRMSNKPFWIIKNSWGPHWGEHGYYKLCRGYGECGIHTMVTYVVAKSSLISSTEATG